MLLLYLEGRLLIEIIAVPKPFTGGFNHGLCRQEEHDKVNIRQLRVFVKGQFPAFRSITSGRGEMFPALLS